MGGNDVEDGVWDMLVSVLNQPFSSQDRHHKKREEIWGQGRSSMTTKTQPRMLYIQYNTIPILISYYIKVLHL